MKLFIVYGVIITILFIGAGMRGIAAYDSVRHGSSWAGGGGYHGHVFHHK